MKISYVCAFSEIAHGGDSRVAWELARYMAKNTQNEVWMICPGESYIVKNDDIEPHLKVQIVPSTEAIEGVRLFSPVLNNVLDLYHILDELNPDIIHAHNPDPLAFVIQGWTITRKKPFVYTGHLLASNINDWQSFNLGKAIEKVIGVSLRIYTKTFYKNCTKIICLNKYAEQDFIKFTNEASKMVVIPNGQIFKENVNKSSDIEKSPEYNLIFAGYISERKNQLFLIESLKYLKTKNKVNLILARVFLDKDYEKLVNKKIKGLPNNCFVKLLGFVDHEKLLLMYEHVHFFVSAALAEVQSLSIIEALGTGTPVIGLENTTTLELVKNNYNGITLKAKSSPIEFAYEISGLLNISNKEYIKLSKNSRKSVRFLEYSNVAKQYQYLYMSLHKKNNLVQEDYKVLEIFGRFFKWDVSNLRLNGKKINYNIALGLMSTIFVSGMGLVSIYNGVKEKTRHK